MEEKDLIEETTKEQPTEGATDKPITMDEIQKMIQSETDKVRTEYVKKVKALETEKEELEKAKMTEEEQKKFELEKLQKELTEKEGAIQRRELTIKTVDLMREAELPLEFRDFIIGADEENTKEKLQSFKVEWDKALKEEVEKRFKGSGREIQKTTSEKLNPFEQAFRK